MIQKDESVIMQEPSFTAADGSFEANFEFGQEQEQMVFEDEPLIDFNGESIMHAEEPIVHEEEAVVQVEKTVAPVEEEVDEDGFTTSTLNTITILKIGFSKSGELSFGELNVKVRVVGVNIRSLCDRRR